MADPKVLGIVLAGGEGKRLSPLTLDRAKPAVPFGGLYRLIDFALSNLIHDEKPDLVIVFGADHVYRMDPRQMIAQHVDSGAGATVAGIPVPREEASAFGVIKTASDGLQVEAFLEKPPDPPGLPGRPDETFASMGNYLFSADVLVEALRKDAADESSKKDMGGNIMPMMVYQGIAQVYDF